MNLYLHPIWIKKMVTTLNNFNKISLFLYWYCTYSSRGSTQMATIDQFHLKFLCFYIGTTLTIHKAHLSKYLRSNSNEIFLLLYQYCTYMPHDWAKISRNLNNFKWNFFIFMSVLHLHTIWLIFPSIWKNIVMTVRQR